MSGDTLLEELSVNGLGEVDTAVPTGQPAPMQPLSRLKSQPRVLVGGADAEVTFAGFAPGFIGLYQINALIGENVAIGGDVPVTIEIAGPGGRVLRSNSVTMAIESPRR